MNLPMNLPLLLPLEPPYDLCAHTVHVFPGPTCAPVFRATRDLYNWRIHGKKNQISSLECRKSGILVSCWSRLFGGIEPPRETYQPLLFALCEDLARIIEGDLNIYYDVHKPPSLSSVARGLLAPYLSEIWKPTKGQCGQALALGKIGARIQVFPRAHV